MNENKERFSSEYTKALIECVSDPKHEYCYGVDQVPGVVAKMLPAIFSGSASYDGPAIKLTCKRLGIKATRKAILAYVQA